MRKFLSFLLSVVILGGILMAIPVFSANFNDALSGAGTAAGQGGAGFNVGDTVESKIATIINAGLSMIGVIFLVLMIYGGYIWMAARGDEAEAKKAKGIITMAIIGLVVVVAAYAISAFVVGRLIAGATTPATTP